MDGETNVFHRLHGGWWLLILVVALIAICLLGEARGAFDLGWAF